MKIHLLENRTISGYTTFGSVYRKGEVSGDSRFALKDSSGGNVPVQTRISAYWPDGSVKWAAHTADSKLLGRTGVLEPAGITAAVPCTEYPASITLNEHENGFTIDTGKIQVEVPRNSGASASPLMRIRSCSGKAGDTEVYPVFRLEQRISGDGSEKILREEYPGAAEEITLLEAGPLQVVVRLKGPYKSRTTEHRSMQWIIYAYLWAGSEEIKFVHTFLYDGDADRDFINGFGIRLLTHLSGKPYNRHVKFGTGEGVFHETAQSLFSCSPRLPDSVFEAQMQGALSFGEYDEMADEASKDLPVWNEYVLAQNSISDYFIKKRTCGECCYLDSDHGLRAQGTVSVTGEKGGIAAGIKDFRQKYPGAVQVRNLAGDSAETTLWFYSPFTESYDLRHYDRRSYVKTLYEGYDFVQASPYGIGVTSECRVKLVGCLPRNEEIKKFGREVQRPPVYAADPEYYYAKRAFGFWSLKQTDTEVEEEIEDQLRRAVRFYEDEIRQRQWYGLFDYGDVMHKYDPVRHRWRYDMGGFAWQNTELVPTYWLWISFLRSGESDIFDIAEAMTRHCSEVDMYHIGPLKGIGTRHNVRHWGCPCKEPRISMAGHHRFCYYLTGDYRIRDVMRDSADAERSMRNLRTAVVEKSKTDGKEKVLIRSGPDWTSFVCNWMTAYEQTLDQTYLQKILNGIDDICRMPFGLASGPEFLLDEENGHLEYTGEHEESINMHLQVCQGGTHIWLELMDMLDGYSDYGTRFAKLLAEYGKFYMLSPEEKRKATNGLIDRRPFSFPYFASGLAAFSSAFYKDEQLAGKVLGKIFSVLYSPSDYSGFRKEKYMAAENGMDRYEIPWISTNMVSQWSLNMILVMEFLKEKLPKSSKELKEIVSSAEAESYKKG